jgi:hypothetical protein
MNTTTDLTVQNLQDFAHSDEWGGFGYIGTSRHASDSLRAKMDDVVIMHANLNRWSHADLFLWANSTKGRHAADVLSDGSAKDILTRYTQAVRWGLMELPTD